MEVDVVVLEDARLLDGGVVVVAEASGAGISDEVTVRLSMAKSSRAFSRKIRQRTCMVLAVTLNTGLVTSVAAMPISAPAETKNEVDDDGVKQKRKERKEGRRKERERKKEREKKREKERERKK